MASINSGGVGMRKRGRNRLIDSFSDIASSDVAKKIQQFDLYPKASADVVEKTTVGAIVSAITTAFVLFLFISEFIFYISTTRKDTLSVDTTVGGTLEIIFNITFPSISCNELTVDTVDASGEQHIDVHYSVYKSPVTAEGRIIEMPHEEVIGSRAETDPHSPFYCGSCYEANERGSKKCCNTCEEVMRAYQLKGLKPPAMNEIRQCIEDLSNKNPGCNMAGKLGVQRVTGNFHFAPGRSFMQSHDTHIHHVHEYNPRIVTRFNTTHIIHKLWFGDRIRYVEYPLDGKVQVVEKDHALFKYFIKVVPTVYQRGNGKEIASNQISTTKHRVDFKAWETTTFIPGVFFVYDLSPIMIKYHDTRMPFSHFLVNICAVIGGVFAVSGYLNKLINWIWGKIAMSKVKSTAATSGQLYK